MTTPNELAGLIALKPCPFCGGTARWIEDTGEFDSPFGLVVDHAETCFLGSRMMAEWDHIVAAWNTRSLSPTEAPEPLLEAVENISDAMCWAMLDAVNPIGCCEMTLDEARLGIRAALSSSISNAEPDQWFTSMPQELADSIDTADLVCRALPTPTEDSGEVVQADTKEPWEVLRDIVTPSPFNHNKAAWSIMLDLILRDHRLSALSQSPDSGRFTPERIRTASVEVEHLSHELDITNADHIALWLETNKDNSPLGWLACRIVEAHEARLAEILANPPKHKFWGTGEPDCPSEIKAGNGELHTLRCKVCGLDNPRNAICIQEVRDAN